jgi:hypothetical protein
MKVENNRRAIYAFFAKAAVQETFLAAALRWVTTRRLTLLQLSSNFVQFRSETTAGSVVFLKKSSLN